MSEIRFELRLGCGTLSAQIQVPAEPIRPVEGRPRGSRVGSAAARAADRLYPCETEPRYLGDLLAAMPEDRRQELTARFLEVIEALAASGLLQRLREEPPSDPAEASLIQRLFQSARGRPTFPFEIGQPALNYRAALA